MVIRGLLATAIALGLAGAAPVVAQGPTPSPAHCSAAMAAYYDQAAEIDKRTADDRDIWTALTFRQKDGALLMLTETVRLAGEVAETGRILDACGAEDPAKRMPALPPPPSSDPKACRAVQTSALEAFKQVSQTASRGETCAAVDRSIEISRGLMDDLEAGRIACDDAPHMWVSVGDRALMAEMLAFGAGCRTGTVSPTMATMSPAPRS